MTEPSMEESLYGAPPQERLTGPTEPPQQEEPEREEPQEEQQRTEEPLPQFNERYKEPLTGLMFLGRLEDEFSWMGHTFTVRTLTQEEHILAGYIIKDYLGTRSEWRAWTAVLVAAGCMTVDGQEWYVPIETTVDRQTLLRQRFQHVIRNWYPPVIDAVHTKIAALELTSRAVIEEMGKVGG